MNNTTYLYHNVMFDIILPLNDTNLSPKQFGERLNNVRPWKRKLGKKKKR